MAGYRVARPIFISVVPPRVAADGPQARLHAGWIPEGPEYPTRRAAAVAFMRGLDTDLASASDDFVMRHWAVQRKNGWHSIVKVRGV